jgi:hypothetical protein
LTRLLRSKVPDTRQTPRCPPPQFREAKRKRNFFFKKKFNPIFFLSVLFKYLGRRDGSILLTKQNDRYKTKQTTKTKQNTFFHLQRRFVFVAPRRAIRISISIVIAKQKITFCRFVMGDLNNFKIVRIIIAQPKTKSSKAHIPNTELFKFKHSNQEPFKTTTPKSYKKHECSEQKQQITNNNSKLKTSNSTQNTVQR